MKKWSGSAMFEVEGEVFQVGRGDLLHVAQAEPFAPCGGATAYQWLLTIAPPST